MLTFYRDKLSRDYSGLVLAGRQLNRSFNRTTTAIYMNVRTTQIANEIFSCIFSPLMRVYMPQEVDASRGKCKDGQKQRLQTARAINPAVVATTDNDILLVYLLVH